jgi:dUTP pyrophosphatase
MFSKIPLEIKCLDHFGDLPIPSYQTDHSAGMDLCSAEDKELQVGERALISTGLQMAIPEGYEGQIRPRSGISYKQGVIIPNSPGTIDADYRGEVKIILWNLGDQKFSIKRGDRIAQFVLVPIVQANLLNVDVLSETVRGEGGFGHTGV